MFSYRNKENNTFPLKKSSLYDWLCYAISDWLCYALSDWLCQTLSDWLCYALSYWLCYAAGGCELSTTTRVKTAWKKFKDLLPVLSSHHLSFKTRGRVYSSCVRSAMLHASQTWPLTKPNLQRLQQNDGAMIRKIYNVRPQDIVTTRSNELLVQLGIEELDLILKERRF